MRMKKRGKNRDEGREGEGMKDNGVRRKREGKSGDKEGQDKRSEGGKKRKKRKRS